MTEAESSLTGIRIESLIDAEGLISEVVVLTDIPEAVCLSLVASEVDLHRTVFGNLRKSESPKRRDLSDFEGLFAGDCFSLVLADSK